MSIVIEPILDRMKLIGEEDPEENKKLRSDSLDFENEGGKSKFEMFSEIMDTLFLKKPREEELNLSSDSTDKKVGTTEEAFREQNESIGTQSDATLTHLEHLTDHDTTIESHNSRPDTKEHEKKAKKMSEPVSEE